MNTKNASLKCIEVSIKAKEQKLILAKTPSEKLELEKELEILNVGYTIQLDKVFKSI